MTPPPIDEYQPLTPPKFKSMDTNFIFLSLYLILFAYFMYLVAISTMESKKVEEGLKSVQATFTGKAPKKVKTTGKLMRGYKKGGKFDQKIQGAFQNLMPDKAFHKRGNGESIEIIVAPTQVFSDLTRHQVSEKGLKLLSRIVHILKEPVGGKAVELAVLISRNSKGVLRAENRFYGEKDSTMLMGTLARTMIKIGVNDANFSVGFHEEKSNQLIFKFRRAVVN